MESGEIPVIVPFPIKRDNSVNGTVREHPGWRRCWCELLRGAAGAPAQGGCCPPVEPAAGAGPGRPSGGQHAREPAAGRRAPRPALDGKRPARAGGAREPGALSPRPALPRPCRPVPVHASVSASQASLSLCSNF